MKVLEQQCPSCRARLRLRGPVRHGQHFQCPDCDSDLSLNLEDARPAITVRRATSTATRPGPTNLPRMAALGVSGALLIALLAFLFSDHTEVPPREGASAAAPTIAVSEPSPIAEVQANEPTGQRDRSLPGPASTPTPEPSPELSEPVLAQPAPLGSDPVPVVTQPVIQPPAAVQPTEAQPTEAQRLAARDEALAAEVRQKLDMHITAYRHSKPVPLKRFLDEVAALSGVWINPRGASSRESVQIRLSLANCTVGDVLRQGLAQAGLRYEAEGSGVRILPAEPE